MSTLILKAQQLDIEGERQQILDGLKSGDLTDQCHACERICTLAENYFPRFLSESVRLIAAANNLTNRIRMQTISNEDQNVTMSKIIESAVELLAKMVGSPPVPRIQLDSPGLNPSVKAEITQLEATLGKTGERATIKDLEDNEKALLRFIVKGYDPRGGQLIFTQNITKTYPGSSFVLHPISLELNRGEILGIVGVNASGKTTLLRILLGELRQSSGLLTYPTLAPNPYKVNWIKIKRRIAYVSQTLPRWPGRVLDNLRYVASIYGHKQTDIDAYLDLLLQRYGLDTFKDSTWDEISGGYKTRFEIVRALLSKPDILVLDEPLAYLDIISQQVVLRQLRQLARNKDYPIGVIITSQQLYEIESIADRLLVLDGGNTLFSGPISRLATQINDIVVEFGVAAPMTDVRKRVLEHKNCRTLFATETGYIAIFRKQNGAESRGAASELDFNDIIEFLGKACPGQLSYVRNISHSCRLMFEPGMMDWLQRHGGVHAMVPPARSVEL